MANVIFKSGSRAQYAAATKDQLTFYRVENTDNSIDLYLGELKLSNDADMIAAVNRIAANEVDIDQLQSDLAALKGSGTGSVADQIDKLKTELEGKITSNTTAINAEVIRAQGAEATLQGNIDDATESISNLTTQVSENKTALDTEDARLAGLIAANTKKIGDNETAIGGVQGQLTDLETKHNTDINRVEGKVTTLIGDDASKSVRAIAVEEVAKVVADAPENFNTLKEIADWIQNDTTGAAALANQVQENKDNIAKNAGNITANAEKIATNTGNISKNTSDIAKNKTDIANNAAAIAEINDASNGILAQAKTYTNTEVKKVSDKLSALKETNTTAHEQLQSAITSNTTAIEAINNTTTGILAQATAKIDTLRNSLGTAAYKDVEYFTDDATSKANTALASAKSYSNENLATAKQYTDDCLTWKSI